MSKHTPGPAGEHEAACLADKGRIVREEAVQARPGVSSAHQPSPGPWTVGWWSEGYPSMRLVPSVASAGLTVAKLHVAPVTPIEQALANAHLIASAPTMYDALRACEEVLRLIHGADGIVRGQSDPMPEHSTFGAWRLAVEAIAKARNESVDHHPGENLPQPDET